MIDFNSNQNDYLFSPNLKNIIQEYGLIQKLDELALKENLHSHVFILSSGTTQKSAFKGYVLAKKAILKNAQAVNEHLALNKDDTWLCSLPHYHIGGLSIYARASLLGAKVEVFSEKWDVHKFYAALDGVKLVSVVPTQCFDIVKAKLKAPPGLKYLIVGADFLNESLHGDLISLGWPVIRTFGMTEVCSQLATESAPSKGELKLSVLLIHQVSITKENQLLIKSPSLFKGIFKIDKDDFHYEPLSTDSYLTQDLVKIESNLLYPLGRVGNEIKIKGRLVDSFKMKNAFKELLYQLNLSQSVQMQLREDPRDGYTIVIYTLNTLNEDVKNKIIQHMKPIDISEFRQVADLARTELGKDKT